MIYLKEGGLGYGRLGCRDWNVGAMDALFKMIGYLGVSNLYFPLWGPCLVSGLRSDYQCIKFYP